MSSVRKTVIRTRVRPRVIRRTRVITRPRPLMSIRLPKNILNKVNNVKRRPRRRVRRIINSASVNKIAIPRMSAAATNYMHCRMDPFQSSGALGIPDLSDQMRVVVDHRLVCNFTVGTSGGFNIAVMPWLPHPLLVQPLDMNDPSWLYNGVHPTGNNSFLNPGYYFAPATFKEWYDQQVFRNEAEYDLDTVSPLYQSKRFRFVTIGCKIIYTGSTMLNAGTVLVNDGSFNMQQPERNNSTFTIGTAATSGVVAYTADEITASLFLFKPDYTVRSNSSLNTPIKTGAYLLLKNQQPDHPWLPLYSPLNFPTEPGISDYGSIIAAVPNPLSDLRAYAFPCVQAWDSGFAPKLISIQGMSTGSPFQLELVYCVEYAIDPSSTIVSLAKQPPTDVKGVNQVDEIMKQHPSNVPLGNEIVQTIGTTVSDAVSGIASAFSPFSKPQRISNRI